MTSRSIALIEGNLNQQKIMLLLLLCPIYLSRFHQTYTMWTALLDNCDSVIAKRPHININHSGIRT